MTCKSGDGYNGEVITVSCMAGEKMEGLIWKDQPLRPVWESTPLCDVDPDGPPAETVPVCAALIYLPLAKPEPHCFKTVFDSEY